MSALLPKADIRRHECDVRFTPQKQTLELSRVMSALCHKRTYAVLYTRAADRRQLAKGAMHKLANER